MGTPTPTKVKRIILTVVFTIFIFTASFAGIWGISVFEKLRRDWVLSDCNGEDEFNIEKAYDDFMLPKARRNGLMNCYCREKFDRYGFSATKILFADGE